jgi:hypothetical protein
MRWRYRITNARWRVVKLLNRKAYLRHAADNPDCDPEDIQALLCLDTNKWVRRGARVNVWVDDIPLPEGVRTHWETAYDGAGYVPWDTLRKLQKIVEDAEYEKSRRRREGRELWVKYFTAIAAALAALASFANLYFSYTRK